jgi:hypothetical protein
MRNPKLPREFRLRDARSVSGPDDDIPFARGETEIRRRGIGGKPFEDVGYGTMDHTQGTNVWGPNSLWGMGQVILLD